jgi:hypothetical protein
MKELVDKLSSYNLFNYLFPGIIFALSSKGVTGIDLIQENVFLGLFLYYFYGLLISRIGSLIIEGILKAARFVKFASYSDFVCASKIDEKINLLSENSNMYRTLLSMIFCLALLYLYTKLGEKIQWLDQYKYLLLGILLLTIFLFSYKKQTKYITKRIDANLGKE